jgi:DNA replication protein DnaC
MTENCPICDNTGWKALGDERNRRVVRCDCQAQARFLRLFSLARIPKRYEHCELANFEVPPGPFETSLSGARLRAGRFVEEYPIDKTGLLFIGPNGVGKTHLAVGIIKQLIRTKGVPCVFYEYRELLKQIQNSYNREVNATEMSVLRPVLEAEVLVLDELGAIKPTEWVWDTVSHLLNTRYNNNRTTIITTNLADLPEREPGSEDLRSTSAARRAASEPTLGDRITNSMRSRLHEMCRIIEMQGEDRRMRANANLGPPTTTRPLKLRLSPRPHA